MVIISLLFRENRRCGYVKRVKIRVGIAKKGIVSPKGRKPVSCIKKRGKSATLAPESLKRRRLE